MKDIILNESKQSIDEHDEIVKNYNDLSLY